MRAAFAMGGKFKPNAGKYLILENIILICLSFIVSFVMLEYGAVENQEALSVFEKTFLFVTYGFFIYALLAFIVTPIGWLTAIYHIERANNQTKSAN